MAIYTCRNVGYDANKRAENPVVEVEAATWTEAVGVVLGRRVSFAQRINPLSSIYAAYAPSGNAHTKIGCVEHIRTEGDS